MSLESPLQRIIKIKVWDVEMIVWDFSLWRKVGSYGADIMSAGRLLQALRTAAGNAQVLLVDSLNSDTTRRLVLAEQRDCEPGRSATRTTGPRYSGVIPCRTLNVSTAILRTTRSTTCSQCKLKSASVMWSKRQSLNINRVAAFYTLARGGE